MTTFFNYLKCILLGMLFAGQMNAQSPGGVSTDLGLWLRAADLATNPAATSGSGDWPDARSGFSAVDAVYVSAAANSLYGIGNGINFNKTIRINDEFFESPVDINLADVSVFMVYQSVNSLADRPLWGNGSSTVTGKQAYVHEVADGTSFTAYGPAGTHDKTYLSHINTVDGGVTDNSSIYINGNAGTPYTVGTTVDPAVHSNFFIGKEKTATVPSHTTNTLAIAEVLVYKDAITPAHREQINSYLGIKYGINLGHDYTINNGNITVWDRTVGSFNNNVVGIARDDISELNISKSKSEDDGAIVTLSTTQTIPNNGALLVGHNAGITTGSAPFTTDNFFVKGRRLNRIWRCQKTANFPTTVDIAIDENISLPTNYFTLGNMVLLVSDQSSVTTNLRAYPLTKNGGNYEATGVTLADGEFFTIGYLDVALWVKADASQNVTTSGTPFSYYDNIMGINDMSSPSMNENPTHVLGTDPSNINFNPYIKFNDGALNQYIGKSNLTAFGKTGVSTFMVLRRNANNVTANDFESMFSYAVSGQPNEMVLTNPPNITVSIKETSLNAGHNSSMDMTNSIPHVFTNRTGTNNNNEIRLDGTSSNANHGRSEVIDSKGTLIFGQEQDNLGGGFDTDQAYEGDIAEAIVFNSRVTDVHRNQIETYLGIKYGITLDNNYVIQGNSVLWNKNNNSTYHNNIACIAREDTFDLNQPESTSQNGASVDVSINYTTPFSVDESYLIWGCNTGIYDNLSLTNAPAGYQTSDKIWKVKNKNNRVGLVEVTLRIPPSLASVATNKLKLIVENTNVFSGAATFYSSSSSTPGFITFVGVNLRNNDFFSLALEDSPTIVSYDNSGNTGAPTSFEACVGDAVTFTYSNLTSDPNKLQLTDDQGGTFNINLVNGVNLTPTPGLGASGIISIVIPPNASTGNVKFIDSSSTVIVVYNFNNNLIIHKPVVEFYLPPAPYCATDTMPLIGIPAGGVFSATPANLIFNNHSLVGINANWSTNINDSIQDVSIDYTYTPTYLNGQACATPLLSNQIVQIRDNRLDTLTFQSVILNGTLPTAADRIYLHVDSSIVQKISPRFSPTHNYPITFTGNHVNRINGVDSFFTDHAGYSSNDVTMEYNNGGCIGSLTSDLDVLFPLQLSGIVDILCEDADSIILKRDSRPEYAYTSTTTSISSRVRETIETNIIDLVTTQNPLHQSAITTVNTNNNQEEYYLDPKVPALNGFNTVVVVMHYTASKITTENLNSQGNVVSTSVRMSSPSTIEYPITLEARPVLDFDIDSIYCKNALPDSLHPSPVFESPFSRFNYRFSYFVAGPYSPFDSLGGEVFDASYIYDQAVPLGAQNQDLHVELQYVIDRYGCRDTYSKNTKIIRPIAFSLFLDPPPVVTGYCKNATPIKLEPINTMTNALGVGEFLVNGVANSPLLDTGNYFLPDSALSQNYNISYQFTDTSNCVSNSTVKIISIREPAVIELRIDGNATNPRICANRDDAILETVLISGSGASSITYSSTNLIIVGDTLKPADSYNNVNGTIIQNITVDYRDSFSCAASDDILVEVYKPLPRMAGFLGNPNNNIYTYCNNKSPFSIIETPNHITGRDTILGIGVNYVNGVYSYDPNLIVVDSSIMDTVRYEYEDALGCTAFTERIVRIDSIPDISLTGLDTAYCVNNAPVQLNGTPNSSSGFARYLGAGVDQQGIFSPNLAGIGVKNITYSFEDGNGCENTVTDLTTINALPITQFNFPQNQYCTSSEGDTLNTSFPTGTYSFWGSIIDSNYIINPLGAVGQQTVFYSLTDSLGCLDTNSTTIFVHPLPTITISGLDSAYCFNGGIDNILISPTAGSILTGSAPGFSINSTGVTFDPSYDSSGVKVFTYAYQDNITRCVDTVWLNTTVYQVPSPIYTGGDSVYCAIDSLYSITGIPAGGMFSGAGVSNVGSQYYFNPIFTGGGNQTLNYRIDTNIIYNSIDTLSCPVIIDIPIIVNQLPNLAFNGPGDNYRFCSNELNILLGGVEPTKTWRLFTSPTLGAIDTIISFIDIPMGGGLFQRVRDTAYFFSPGNAGAGIHNITYTGTDSITGCQDTIPLTYYVTDYGTGASFLLDSAYCASSDSILLTGNPAGGHFLRNQDTLSSSYFVLSTSVYLSDTVTYHVTYDACMASDTQVIEVNPLVNLSFVGNELSKTYCFGGDDSPLVPNISGGTFNGSAVISGDSLFSLQYANAGDNIIHYTFIDSATLCESTARDTFFVFGMPNIDFQAIGGCQSDSIFFHPDNTILGLNNTFGSRIIDSITDIVWELEPGLFITGSNNALNEIDSINHVFNTPGVYYTKLYVANRTYCVDTTTVRVVISPTITSNQFPYDETFENSNGNWYAEAKDTSHNLLWDWGTDTLPAGIDEPNNNIWVTNLNGRYGANEAAWVYSPCFDISSLERPMIRFDHWSDTRNRGDGTVLEFQNTDGTWTPLGELDRGINWFNSDFIAGSPGNQVLSPIGWSGQSNDWINSRYKLDEFKNTQPSKLRLRMAFGSSSINLGTFYNGFAFDNVWIGNRTRNVLLETTSNIYEPDMDNVNNYVYQLAYHSSINKDVILLQYHSEAPNDADEFHQYNRAISNARTLFYGIFDAGTAFIDGISNTRSKWLDDLSFEQNMLESPKFEVEIDTFYHTNPGQFTLTTTITALVDITAMERYRINMVITEDSLSYTNGENVHAVVRKDYPSNSTNTFDRTWAAGDQVTLTHVYSSTGLNYVPNHFQAVVFIQAQLDSAREVFQAATTRDVSGYWLGVDQVASEQELNEIKDMTLYPNPAKDYINIDFPELLEKDYNWKLISIGGITVKEDVIHAGEQSLTINNYDLPSGVYIFMVYNGNVYSQRKVIINQN